MVKITGKNGKPLYGAAREPVLRKLDAKSRKSQEEQEIMLLGLSDALTTSERAAKNIPLLLVAALASGCESGNFAQTRTGSSCSCW